jgi:hypothetical protein
VGDPGSDGNRNNRLRPRARDFNLAELCRRIGEGSKARRSEGAGAATGRW